MSKKPQNSKTLQRVLQLQEKRRKILELPPLKALDHILDDPQPAALVHSFPEQDFYLLVNEIGAEDSLPLLSLATNKQWEHIVDLETWQKDRLDPKAVTRWLSLLLEADAKRFFRWFLEEKLEFIELYLFRNIEVRIREHDQDPSDFDDDYFSRDIDKFEIIRIVQAKVIVAKIRGVLVMLPDSDFKISKEIQLDKF